MVHVSFAIFMLEPILFFETVPVAVSYVIRKSESSKIGSKINSIKKGVSYPLATDTIKSFFLL